MDGITQLLDAMERHPIGSFVLIVLAAYAVEQMSIAVGRWRLFEVNKTYNMEKKEGA